MLHTVFILICLDIVLGLLGGFIDSDLNSSLGLVGVVKHTIVILLLIVLKYLAECHSLTEYYNMVVVFYAIQYSLSILENVYGLGIPVPDFLMTRLKVYQDKEGLDRWQD